MQCNMSVWSRIGNLVTRASANAASGVGSLLEAMRSLLEGDPELRRRVAFSIAMIALSAKMAKADGIVTHDEVRAFQQIFAIPEAEMRNVSRLYNLAKSDTAGFEAYAHHMAGLCGSGRPDCPMLKDVLEGLFHIATADGVVHEREVSFLRRTAEIFSIDDLYFEGVLARHTHGGRADPYVVLGVTRTMSFADIRSRYHSLMLEHHPDRVIARGVPAEFTALAKDRVAAINVAFETIERGRLAA